MNDLKCYVVTCKDSTGKTYDVGVANTAHSMDMAVQMAISNLHEGQHVDAVAVACRVADAI